MNLTVHARQWRRWNGPRKMGKVGESERSWNGMGKWSRESEELKNRGDRVRGKSGRGKIGRIQWGY